MNNQSSTLVAHCDTHKITRDELMTIPIPEGTKTHQPISHYKIVEVLEEALSFRYLKIVRDEYAVSQNGMKMFGVMDLNAEFSGCRFSIGLRNSNDKSMRLALTAGYRVFVCDNMAFSGDFTPLLHKHTRNLELKDSISIAVDRIHRGFEPLKESALAMRGQVLTEDQVRLIIYQAFLDKNIKGIPRHLMPVIHELYFNPQHEAFTPRNLWSLSNAFTSAFKKLAPVKQFEATAKLGTYLADVQEEIKQRQELYLPVQKQKASDQLNQNQPANNARVGFQNDAAFIACTSDDIDEDRDFGFEDFDEDDIADDLYDDDEFDDYFDAEIAAGEIDEAEDRMIEEYERKLAA